MLQSMGLQRWDMTEQLNNNNNAIYFLHRKRNTTEEYCFFNVNRSLNICFINELAPNLKGLIFFQQPNHYLLLNKIHCLLKEIGV